MISASRDVPGYRHSLFFLFPVSDMRTHQQSAVIKAGSSREGRKTR